MNKVNPPGIIVNAEPLRNIATGIGRYIRELYSHMHRLHPELEIKYFDGNRVCDHMPTPPTGSSAWTSAVKLAWSLPAVFPYTARILAHKKSAARFREISEHFDIYHEAGYFPYKAADHVKTVFTIHDLSLKILPEFHPRDRVLFFRKYFEMSLPRADTIITPSEFTKREIQKTYPELKTEIQPIPLGCDKSLFCKGPPPEIDDFKSRKHLPEKYVLFAGTSDPRKNIKTIIKAMDRLPETIKLVCTGWSGWGRLMGKNSPTANLKDRIIFTGYVSDSELALLYSGARAFVYPSFYEGFGLPVLEAMACGCPVVCSNSAGLPEVAGRAAILCEPDDPDCLADALAGIFTSDSLYSQLSSRALEQSAEFSWERTAEKTLKVFTNLSCNDDRR